MEPKTLHVLLVDDDPNQLAAMQDILKAKGFESLSARTARAAMAHCAAADIDVALIDLHLEDMPGLELLRQLRSKFASTECILLTGHASQGSAIEAINAGAFSYFQKPCDMDQLVLSIRRAGEKRFAAQALRDSEASLQAVLQSTADGILAVNRENKVLYANQRFAELWRIPPAVLASQEDAVLLQYVLDQLVEPQVFLQKVQELYRSEEDSFDMLDFKDGRIFERHSRPLMQEAELRGRVWSFRDVTERKKAEKLQETVYRIAQAADQAESLDSLYLSIHASIKQVMAAENFFIALFDKETGLLSYPYFTDEEDAPVAPQATGKSLTSYVLRRATSLLCDEALFDSLKQRGEVELVGVASPIWLGVPLLVAGEAIGVMAVQDYKNAQTYGEREQHILEFVSSQVAEAIYRKQSEEALIRAEQKYRSIFENATEGIHQTTPDGKIISVNLAGARMLGFDSPEELMANASYLNSHFYVQPGRRAEFQRLMETQGALTNFESEVYRKDGGTAWLSENVHCVRDEQGNLLYYEGTSVDITEPKRAEEKLADERTLLRTLIDNLPDRVYVMDAQGRKILANRADWQTSGGKTMEDVIGKTDFDTFPPELAQDYWAVDKSVIDSGTPIINLEEPGLDSQGNPVSLLSSKIPLRDGQGRITGLVGVGRDITERKQVEEKLKASEEMFRSFIEQSSEGVVLLDEHGSIIQWNHAQEQITGIARRQAIGVPFWDIQYQLLPPEHRSGRSPEFFKKAMRAAFQTGKFPTSDTMIETTIYTPAGETRSILQASFPIKTEKGYRVGSLIRDITGRKQAEAALRESEERYRRAIAAAGLVPYGIDYQQNSFSFLGEDILKLTSYSAQEFTPAILRESVQENHVWGQEETGVTVEEATRRFMAGEIKKWGSDLRIRTRSGAERWISDVSVPLLDEHGKVTAAIGIFQDLTERKQAEAELRLSEERYRMLAENMTDTIWLMDLDLKTSYISPSVMRLRGYTLEELNTVPLDQQMEPESFERLVKMFNTELAPDRLAQADLPISTTLELEMLKKDGSTFWSENTFSLIRDPCGQPLAILGSGRDITESKNARAALENSEKRFRALIENNTDAIVLVDPRGRILYVSPAYSKLTGYAAHQRLGQSSFEFINPEDQPSIARMLHELVQSPGRTAQVAFSSQHKDGSWRWFEATATNLLGESAVQAVVINLHDITERKQAEVALRESEERFRVIFEKANDGISITNANDEFIAVNTRFCEILGYDRGRVLKMLVSDIQAPELRKPGDVIKNELARHGNSLFEGLDLHRSGRRIPVEISVGRMELPSGDLYVSVVRDITERKQAEQDLRQRVTQLEVLYETGLHISSLLEPREIGRKVIQVLSEKMSWSHASIRLYHPETQRLELLVFNRPGLTAQQLQAEIRRLNRIISKPGQGMSGWVIQNGQSIRSGDVNADPRFIRTFPGIQSGLYVPMLVGGRCMGVIGVESESSEAFTDADERLLTTLAAQAGVAIENARLLAETLRQVGELSALADVSSALRTALTRSEIVAVILDQLMMGLFHADDAGLAAYDPVTGENIVEAARGKFIKWIGRRLPPGEGVAGKVAQTHLPFQTEDFLKEDHVTLGNLLNRPEAAAVLPLLVQNQFIGSLWIGRTSKKKSQSPAPFTSDEMRLLGSVADMVANALQRASLYEQTMRHAEELLAVNKLGRILAETLNLDQIYEKLDESVWRLLGDISLVAIVLYDPDKKQLTCVWLNNDGVKLDATVLPPVPLEPPGQGTQSEAIHTRQPVIINDLRQRLEQINFKIDVGTDDGRETQSGLYVPMLVHGRVIGIMQVLSYTLKRFSQSEADLLSLVANTAAVDIENARLFAETQKRLHNLAALHEIDVAISASVDIHVTLDILLEKSISELNVDAAAVLLLNPLARTLEYAASHGFRKNQVQGLSIPLGAGLAGQAALKRQILSASNRPDGLPLRDPRKPGLNIYEDEGFVVHFAMPLSAKGQVQGVLEVFRRSPLQPDEEWFTFLETLSRQAAIAIDNNNLFDDLQRSNTNIILAYDATIQGWSQALELRDKETEGHARRVTERTVQLAQLVGIPATDLEHVRRGTLLHDIGKMGIPDAILLKPGSLTQAEWAIMRRHPVLAYEMLSSIAYLRPALDIPHYHHEKWDGTGYPDGLKGEQIPLFARIFSVVDVYDALTSDRSYRSAWSPAQAVEYIHAEAGKHFDPAIVETFLNMLVREK